MRKNVDKDGINVMNIKTIMAATINGTTPLDMPIIFVLEIPAATYRLSPTGGVKRPIARFTVMNTPNTVGSYR